MSDEKVRDILNRLTTREVCGSIMNERVGRRAWQRPRVAISGRLYKQYRVPDPWDPTAKKDSTPIGLGPVSLRLGEKRRQPAPHLKPKEPKQKKKAGPRDPLAGLPNIPRARSASSTPKTEAPKATSPKPTPSMEEKEERAAKVAERMRAAEAARGGPRRRRIEESQPSSPAPAPVLPVRPDAGERVRSRMSEDDLGPTDLQDHTRPSRGASGRFRMQAKKVTNAPVVRRRVEDPVVSEHRPDEVEAPEPRRTMPPVGGGSMDDFFGAAAQMGRLALPKREETKDEE